MRNMMVLTTVLLMALLGQAQYNPSNPPEPGVHTYRAKAVPAQGGSVSPAWLQAETGKTISFMAYSASGYRFSHWRGETGDTLATSQRLTLTAPAEDTDFEAVFEYSPANPGDPSVPAEYATVNVSVNNPNGAGVTGAGRYKIGTVITLAAYLQPNFRFVNWTRGDEVLSTETRLNYQVLASGNDIMANVEYSPENPGDPARPDRIYTLTLKGTPGAVTNLRPDTDRKYAQGEEIEVSAEPVKGYRINNWTDETGAVVGQGWKFTYTMPGRSVILTANAVYNPEDPSDPSPVPSRRNIIYGSRENVIPGEAFIYNISLENVDNVTGLNVDLTAPEGFDFRVSDASLSARNDGHSLTVEALGSRSWRLMVRGTNPFVGANGPVIRIPVSTPATAAIGSSAIVGMDKGVVFLADGSQDAIGASDGHIRFIAGPDSEISSPDFVVTRLECSGGAIMPGDALTLSWTVANQGNLEAAGGWSEAVFLTDADGRRASLGSLHFDVEKFPVGSQEVRSATFRIPDLPGISGELQPGISVIPNATSGEVAQKQTNNTLIASGPVVILGKRLVLDLPATITEGTDRMIRAHLARSGSWAEPQTFSIEELKGESRLRLPASVTIPRNQSGVDFIVDLIDNTEPDAGDKALVRVSGNDYNAIEQEVTITDNDFYALDLSLESDEVEEGSSMNASVSLPVAAPADITVLVATDSPKRVSVPAKVVLKKGEKSVDFAVEALQNDKVEGEVGVTLRISADGYTSDEAVFAITDDDVPAITLELTPDQISESAGYNAVRAFLRRTSNMDKKVTVDLTDNAQGALIYPTRRVVLEKGQTEAVISLGINDNQMVDGDRDIMVSAAVYLSSCSCSATGTHNGVATDTLRIIDNDGPALTLRTSSSTILEGNRDGIILFVERNTDPTAALDVTLSCDAEDVVEFPHEVTIPAGVRSIQVKVVAPANDRTDDGRTLVFSAHSPDYSKGTCWVMLTDRTLPDGFITALEVSTDTPEANGEVEVKVTVANSGSAPLPLTFPIRYYIRGAKVASAVLPSVIQPGDSLTVIRTLTMPEIPGNAEISVSLNDNREVAELLYTNNTYPGVTIDIRSPYSVSLSSDKKVYATGGEVLLSGSLQGKYKAGDPIQIYIRNIGTRQTFDTVIGPDGNFEFLYKPYIAQTGLFEAGACFPGQETDEAMVIFDVLGVKQDSPGFHEILTGEPFKAPVKVTNNCSVALTGLSVEGLSMPEGVSVKSQNLPSRIEAGETVAFDLEFTGSVPSEERKWYTASVALKGDNGLSSDLKTYLYIQDPYGVIKADKTSITANFPAGKVTEYPVHITNTGNGPTGQITLNLPAWLKAATPATLPSLDPGQEMDVMLRLSMTKEMNLNYPVSGEFGIVCANGKGTGIKYAFTPVSEDKGGLRVRVADEYTYYTDEAPLVANASIRISHPYTGSQIALGNSGSEGIYDTELPAGYYRLDVAAEKHEGCSKVIFVSPGKQNVITANIFYNAIDMSWDVEETDIEDEYRINTVVKYETDVPLPVIKVELPDSIAGDEMALYQATIVNMRLTNVGLIAARNVRLLLPDKATEWLFEPLAYDEPFELAAHQSVEVPIRITRILDISAAEPSQAGKKTFATDTYDTYANCMGYFGAYYEVLCGEDIRNNRSMNKMRMKLCAFMAPLGALANLIPGGPGGPGWDPSGPGGDVNIGNAEIRYDICDPCDAEKVEKGLGWLIDNSGLAWINGVLDSAVDSYLDDGLNAPYARNYIFGQIKDGIEGWVKEKIFGDWTDFLDMLNDMEEITAPCDGKAPHHNPYDPDSPYSPENPRYSSSGSASSKEVIGFGVVDPDRSWMEEFNHEAYSYINQLLRADVIFRYFFGDRIWIKEMDDDKGYFIKYVESLNPDSLPDDETLSIIKPASVTLEQAKALIDLRYGRISSPISDTVFQKFMLAYNETEKAAHEDGFDSAYDRFFQKYSQYRNDLKDLATKSVCATISLGISQTMTMTRQAFRGTLKIFNGHSSKPMKDLRLNLVVRGEDGVTATSREFQINAETLNGFTGELDLDSGWKLESGVTGTATILFIPSKYAAPEKPVEYSFGGTVTYIDPFTDLEVTRNLFPVSLTVNPSPSLELTYFMQRDVYADDPLTPDIIERSEDAEFALIIANRGAGEATNVRLLTEQPEILENEKGLLIDFDLVSSQLNGRDKVLSLGGTMASDFGNIAPGATGYAQWWLRSSLLGHFTDYNVNATHVTSYDNPDLSLLEKVEIHELIRGVSIDPEAEVPVRGFLADDIPDGRDYPDRLYFSDGRDAVAVNAALGVGSTPAGTLQYEVKVVPSAKGWNYGRTSDPTGGRQRLVSVTRKRDGAVMPVDNFWQTSVTMTDGKEPVHEARLHAAVDIEDTEAYILLFEERPNNVLQVKEFVGFAENDSLVSKPVETVDVVFNKAIEPSSFTSEDITLSLRGVKLNTEKVTITPLSPTEYRLGLGDLTIGNGYYVLTVATGEIRDAEGFCGENGAALSWLYFPDGMVTLTVEKTPEEGGTVNRVSERLPYGTVVDLEAEPATGYIFRGWNRNGAFHSADKKLSHVMNDDEIFTARFEKDNSVGLTDTEATGFTVYPLPLRDRMTVTGDFDIASEITLIDMKGAVVGRWTDITPGTTVTLPEIPSGLYMVCGVTSSGTRIIKALKR